MKGKKKDFFYNGIFYSTFEEFKIAINQYLDSPVSQLSATNLLTRFFDDVLINLINNYQKLTNRDFQEILFYHSDFIIYAVRERERQKEEEEANALVPSPNDNPC